MLPMGLGYVEGVTHDYRRHGTTTLFAALDTAKGTVITQCRQRHRHQEYLVSRDREERAGDIGRAHHRGQLRHAQTSASKTLARSTATIPRALHSDLCLVAQSSGDLVQPDYATGHSPRDICSVKELIEKIDQYVQTSNNHAQPFVWTATADSIFAKVQRLCERISGTGH